MIKNILTALAIVAMVGCKQKENTSAENGTASDSLTLAQQSSDPNGSDINSLKAQEVEKLALEILKNPILLKEIEKGVNSYTKSEIAAKPEGIKYVKSAVNDAATLAALYTAMGNVPDPVFVWVYAAPRKWNGYTVPGSRWYADNVDTHYRAIRVNENSTYEIKLKLDKLPSQVSFMMYDWLMYETGTKERSDVPLGTFVVNEKTVRNADGTITLTLGPEPSNGRSNYMQLKPGVKQVFYREIRGDQSIPVGNLSVKRTSGEPQKYKSINELAKEAAVYLSAGIVGTLKITTVFGHLAENVISPLHVRYVEETGSANQKLVTDELLGPDKALGFVSNGLFNLKEDEVFIMTLNMMGAKYLSVNSYRPFLVSPEHVYSSSSLNNYQAKANADGTITFVLSRKDPGVYNWIDVQGIPYGEFSIRWQSLSHPVSGTIANAAKDVKVVKLSDLRKVLPSSTKWVTPEERKQQRELRAKLFQTRCLGTPCEVGGELDTMY
ncbi:DUF1214 domain-containing protein [Flavobacterium sp. RSSA_27]|uniref:DUF1214 domain-containing protein n=1 Tax=Flavobacterium sp. RSSA_27 TaxID=3447667 RepID=UPI003F354D68